MPLPHPDTAWPPATPHDRQMAEWSAWYSGDPDQLAAFYTANGTGPTTRPAQYAGGLVGRVARWWWGTPTPTGQQRTKLHVPLAADICGTSADLLFSESVSLAGDNDKLTETLGTLQDQGLDTVLHEGAEVQAALGGVYLRAMWDRAVQGLPWTDVVHPDGAVPEFRHGRLHAVNLWTDLPDLGDGRVYRLVERHERGAILYRLHAGDPYRIGRTVPLLDHPDAAALAELVNADGVQETGVNRLAVTYVPNMLPNRAARHSHQGRSDLQGLTPMLDALDETYSSWWRDIRHAKARIMVPRQYLESGGPGEGATVDTDREVFVPLDGIMGSAQAGLMLEAQQFAIRVTEHAETCRAWTERIIESAGYSTQSLSSGAGGAVTAAEVHAHERRSYMTRGKKIRYWTAALQDHLTTVVELANEQLGAGIPTGDLSIRFADGVQDSTVQLANTALALRNAEAASTETRVRIVNPDWDAEQVAAEVARITGEAGGVPVPMPDDPGL